MNGIINSYISIFLILFYLRLILHIIVVHICLAYMKTYGQPLVSASLMCTESSMMLLNVNLASASLPRRPLKISSATASATFRYSATSEEVPYVISSWRFLTLLIFIYISFFLNFY